MPVDAAGVCHLCVIHDITALHSAITEGELVCTMCIRMFSDARRSLKFNAKSTHMWSENNSEILKDMDLLLMQSNSDYYYTIIILLVFFSLLYLQLTINKREG